MPSEDFRPPKSKPRAVCVGAGGPPTPGPGRGWPVQGSDAALRHARAPECGIEKDRHGLPFAAAVVLANGHESGVGEALIRQERTAMHRSVILALVSVSIIFVGAGATLAASPSQQMSRYERDVHVA